MKNEGNPNMHRDALLRRAMVPKGYRPLKAQDIEKMLNSIDPVPMSEEKKHRMLRKIGGQQSMFVEAADRGTVSIAELTEVEKEMVVLCRSQGKPLPPDLAAKIKAMEERARNPNPPKDGGNGG